jgi:hypothetical protein
LRPVECRCDRGEIGGIVAEREQHGRGEDV